MPTTASPRSSCRTRWGRVALHASGAAERPQLSESPASASSAAATPAAASGSPGSINPSSAACTARGPAPTTTRRTGALSTGADAGRAHPATPGAVPNLCTQVKAYNNVTVRISCGLGELIHSQMAAAQAESLRNNGGAAGAKSAPNFTLQPHRGNTLASARPEDGVRVPHGGRHASTLEK